LRYSHICVRYTYAYMYTYINVKSSTHGAHTRVCPAAQDTARVCASVREGGGGGGVPCVAPQAMRSVALIPFRL